MYSTGRSSIIQYVPQVYWTRPEAVSDGRVLSHRLGRKGNFSYRSFGMSLTWVLLPVLSEHSLDLVTYLLMIVVWLVMKHEWSVLEQCLPVLGA